MRREFNRETLTEDINNKFSVRQDYFSEMYPHYLKGLMGKILNFKMYF